MLKDRIRHEVQQALEKASGTLNNIEVNPEVLEALKIERPKNAEHGDFAVNVSPLAKQTKMPPPKIAENVQKALGNGHFSTSTVAGFVNFKLSDQLLSEALIKLASAKPGEAGKNQSMADLSILLEYVSANPTGPLHIGHGRWAALGDALIRIFRHCNAIAVPEFYINDAGVQMGNIAKAIYLRGIEIQTGKLPEGEELPYPGEYVIDMAKQFLAQNNNTLPQPDSRDLIEFAKREMLADQRQLLDQLDVTFENWISEYELLHMSEQGQKNLVDDAFNNLKAVGFVYELDGAWWFKTTDFGDEKDRVVKKQDGSYTYLMPDIAYHKHKFDREDLDRDGQPQFNRIINIWGADHHGYIPRMRAALNALALIKDEFRSKVDPEKPDEPSKMELVKPDPRFEVILGQLVNLIIDGEKTRMGKRRKMLTLADVVDTVGVDATRFFMVWKPAETALDFDVELALTQTSENPVFYVQYAHARCASILRNASSEQVDTENRKTNPPLFTPAEVETLESSLTPALLKPLFERLDDPKAPEALKALILKLDGFEDIVIDAGRMRAPHLIARYSHELAADFHTFYTVCRILTPDKELTHARLAVVLAVKKVLAQALALLGVSAPEQM